jgi:iron complex outermembrane receptor protein
VAADRLNQYSQEFRVESKNAGPLNWQSGVYYFKESGDRLQRQLRQHTQAQTSHLPATRTTPPTRRSVR